MQHDLNAGLREVRVRLLLHQYKNDQNVFYVDTATYPAGTDAVELAVTNATGSIKITGSIRGSSTMAKETARPIALVYIHHTDTHEQDVSQSKMSARNTQSLLIRRSPVALS